MRSLSSQSSVVHADWLERAKRSIARVDIPAGEAWTPSGTAFLISETHAATALHVLRRYKTVRLILPDDSGKQTLRSAELVWAHPEGKDLAILRLEGPSTAEPLPFGPLPAPGCLWSTYGFPANVPGGHTLLNNVMADPRKFVQELGHAVMQLGASQAREDLGGLSGAPCIVGERIVGIVSFQLVRASSTGTPTEDAPLIPSLETLYAIPIDLLAGGPLREGSVIPARRSPELRRKIMGYRFEDVVRILTDLYLNLSDPRDVFEVAGTPRIRLEDHSEPLLVWFHVLSKAHRNGKLLPLLSQIRSRFPENATLAEIAKQLDENPRSLEPEWLDPWHQRDARLAAVVLLSFLTGLAGTMWLTGLTLPLVTAPALAITVLASQKLFAIRRLRADREARAAEGFVLAQQRTAFRWLAPFGDDDRLPGASRRAMGASVLTSIRSANFQFGVLSGLVGCGKTSFMRSELKRRLTDAGDTVVFVARPRDLDAVGTPNKSNPRTRMAALEQMADSRSASDRASYILIDQTEEFFVDHDIADAVAEMRACFAHLLARGMRILCAIRHDFLLPMHRLSESLPPLVYQENLFELREFDVQQAQEVIEDCAAQDHIRIQPSSLARTIAAELATGTTRAVRPPELQIVCSALGRDFTEKRYKAEGGWSGLIAGYIQRSIEMCPDAKVAARTLRQLCDFTPAIRNARPAQTIADVASTVEAPIPMVGLILETMARERIVRRVDRERFALMHDYLVDPVGRATRSESTTIEEASLLVNYHVATATSRRFEPIPLRRMRAVWRYAPQLKARDPDAIVVFRRSIARHALSSLTVSALTGALVLGPVYVPRFRCPDDRHLRGPWVGGSCVLNYTWRHHSGVQNIGDAALAEEGGFYICKAQVQGAWTAGYLSSTGCHVEWNNRSYALQEYDALIGPNPTLWQPAEGGASAGGALRVESEHGGLSICRTKRSNVGPRSKRFVVGKVTSHGCSVAGEDRSSAAPDGLPQIEAKQYEVLLDE